MFKGRSILIVTKHKKEQVIAPLLEKSLGVNCVVADLFDTDRLGTFTGEVERIDDLFSTARKKCIYGLKSYDCDLVISSEGSFNQHPEIVFLPYDEEILVFADLKNQMEIVSVERSLETNFSGSILYTENELIAFASRAKFPTHLLILRSSQNDFTDIRKGIKDWVSLRSIFYNFIKKYGQVYAETDMRAMNNPTRMKVIERATVRLIEKINSLCPKCHTPGFDVTEFKRGLPCKVCKKPTRSIVSNIYKCSKCAYTKEEVYPNEKLLEDPMYCDYCNP